MQTHGGEAAARVIEASERRFVPRLRVDWYDDGGTSWEYEELTPFLKSISVDRSLSGSLPANIFLVSGSGAAKLDFTLSGQIDDMNMASVFSPYNGYSQLYNAPLIGSEVTYWIEIETDDGWIAYDQFVGNIRTIEPNTATGEVTVTALDRVEKLRKPVQFPHFAISSDWDSKGVYRNQLVDSSWIIDHCLRFCDTSQTPYVPEYDELQLARDVSGGYGLFVTNAGSVSSSVGHMDFMRHPFHKFPPESVDMYKHTNQPHPEFQDDPEAQQPLLINSHDWGESEHRYYIADRLQSPTVGAYEIMFNLPLTGPGSSAIWDPDNRTQLLMLRAGSGYRIDVHVRDGKVFVRVWSYETSYNEWIPSAPLPTDQDFTMVDIAMGLTVSSDTSDVAIEHDGGTNGESIPKITYTSDPANFNDDLRGLTAIFNTVPIADVAILTRYLGGLEPAGFLLKPAKYGALLDPGLNRPVTTPTQRNEDAWHWIKQAAEAEFGSVFWDEKGRFIFWNLDTMLAKQNTIARELDIGDVKNIPLLSSYDSVRNTWSVEATKKRSGTGNVYEALEPNEFFIAAGTTKRWRFWSNTVTYPHPYKLTRYSTIDGSSYPQWSDDIYEGYVVQFYNAGGDDGTPGWQEQDNFVSGVDIRPTLDIDGFLVLEIHNGYAVDARFATNEGQAAMRVGGAMIHDYPTPTYITRDQNSIEKYGDRNISLSGPFYTDSYQLDETIGKLMPRTTEPIPVTQSLKIPGDPRLQMGDTIMVNDPKGVGEQIKMQIHGIRRNLTMNGGLEDTLLVEIIRPPQIGIWDSQAYGRWDETFIWGA